MDLRYTEKSLSLSVRVTSKTMDTEPKGTASSEESNGFKKMFEIDHFNDEEETLTNPCTRDGSVDCYGQPAMKKRSGGWRCAMLLLVNEVLITLAFTGVEVNLVLFSKSVLRQTNAEASNTFSNWMGTTYFFSLIGAFLSDSYLGRYLTCIIFQAVLLIGLVVLSLSTHLLLKPQGCGIIGFLCEPHTPIQLAMFYISIYLIALGNGATEPALATFGADQFDEEDPKETRSKTSFYSYFYVALNLGSLVAETILVYIETMGDWVLGFWICAGSAVFSFLFLWSGTLRYRNFKPSGNPISRFAQVIAASVRKIKLQLPTNGEGLYNIQEGDGSNGVRRMYHTDGLRFLDRAAIISAEDMSLVPQRGQTPNPWLLCSVTQVEEMKCFLRLLPLWLCTIFSSVVFIQMLSLFIEQGAAMDRTFFNIHKPPASMTAFDIISTSAFIILYDILIVPLYVKLMKRKPTPPSELQRIGIGLVIAIVALIIAGFVERKRLKFADNNGKEISSLSIFWQTPQYVLVGISEAFVIVAQMEFFASQTPDGLKSLGMGLSMSSSALGSYVASFVLTMVVKITASHGKPGWVPPNLNDGHLDRFFFLSASLTAINFILYVVMAKRYKGIALEKREETSKVEINLTSE